MAGLEQYLVTRSSAVACQGESGQAVVRGNKTRLTWVGALLRSPADAPREEGGVQAAVRTPPHPQGPSWPHLWEAAGLVQQVQQPQPPLQQLQHVRVVAPADVGPVHALARVLSLGAAGGVVEGWGWGWGKGSEGGSRQVR